MVFRWKLFFLTFLTTKRSYLLSQQALPALCNQMVSHFFSILSVSRRERTQKNGKPLALGRPLLPFEPVTVWQGARKACCSKKKVEMGLRRDAEQREYY